MNNSKRRSALLSSISFALRLRLCIVKGYDFDRYSSSIVTHDSDISLSGSRRRPQHDYTHHPNRNHLGIHRSFIDRDPIFDGDDGQNTLFPDDDSCVVDRNNDPFSSFHDRTHRANQWQSPLERLAPLPSLSSKSNPSEAAIIVEASPLAFSDGPRRSHEIDFAERPTRDRRPPTKPKTRSTGTTIAALVAQNSTALILAADTRATDGSTVADKRCEKLHALARNAWCAGAGTSADVDALVRRVKFAFWKRGVLTKEGFGGVGNMGTGRERGNGNWGVDATVADEDGEVPTASVPAVLHYVRSLLQKSRGSLGVNLLAGGYDHDSRRAYLAAIHPHGSMDVVTYAALGSGGLAATGVLESKYPRLGSAECSVEEGIRLAVDAVRAGVANDLGSGSQIDVCVIRREGVLYRRAVVREEELEWISVSDGDREDILDVPQIPEVEKERVPGGVNGFGNVPFAIQSKKVVSGGHMDAERERSKWLAGVLGDIQQQ